MKKQGQIRKATVLLPIVLLFMNICRAADPEKQQLISADRSGINPKPDVSGPFELTGINPYTSDTLQKDTNWFPNPSKSRYLLAPSAFNPGRGEGYFQNSYFIYNSIHLGITNHISVTSGIGFVPTVGIGGTGQEVLFFVGPKAEFTIADLLHAGTGILYGSYAGSGTGYTYGLVTYGSEEHNITAGAGWGFWDYKYPGRPVLTLSGMVRISRKLGFVTDNWWIPKDKNRKNFFSYGIRIFWENACVDVAFVNNRDISESIGIGVPYIDVVFQF